MTSRQPLIPGESEAALKAHLEHWNKLYPDVETDELLSDLVREAAFSQWLLFRSQLQYDCSVFKLHETTPMDNWTPEQNHTFQLRERYLNAAHRRLNRHRSDILQYQRNLRSQAQENRTANDYAEANNKAREEAKKDTGPPRPEKSDTPFVQFVHVRQKDGKTETIFTPTNEHLLDHFANSYFETTLVYRSLRFHDHFVPPEYEAFRERAAELRHLPTLERIHIPITFRSLRIAIEREKEFGGHLREWPDLREQDEPMI